MTRPSNIQNHLKIREQSSCDTLWLCLRRAGGLEICSPKPPVQSKPEGPPSWARMGAPFDLTQTAHCRDRLPKDARGVMRYILRALLRALLAISRTPERRHSEEYRTYLPPQPFDQDRIDCPFLGSQDTGLEKSPFGCDSASRSTVRSRIHPADESGPMACRPVGVDATLCAYSPLVRDSDVL